MNETTFQNDQEASEWAEKKFLECRRDDKPDKPFPANWKLSERWFSFDKGRDKSAETVLEESLARSSNDLSSSMSALGDKDQNPKKRSPAGMRKTSLNKTTQLASRLARSLASCEASLPSKRRALAPSEYQLLRDGLCACRLARDQALDDIEDLRALPDSEDAQDDCLEKLNKVATTLQEHNSTLLEAFKKQAVESVIKKDQTDDKASSAGALGLMKAGDFSFNHKTWWF